MRRHRGDETEDMESDVSWGSEGMQGIKGAHMARIWAVGWDT